MKLLKVSRHAARRFEDRTRISLTASNIAAVLTKVKRPIFSMSGGDVYPIPFYYVFAVVKNDTVVTVLDLEQAFTDCPRAVFRYMVEEGSLRRALSFKTKYHNGYLKSSKDPNSVKYPQRCDFVWRLFNRYLSA